MGRYRVIALTDAHGWELHVRDDHNQTVGAVHSAVLDDAHVLVREHLAATGPTLVVAKSRPFKREPTHTHWSRRLAAQRPVTP